MIPQDIQKMFNDAQGAKQATPWPLWLQLVVVGVIGYFLVSFGWPT